MKMIRTCIKYGKRWKLNCIKFVCENSKKLAILLQSQEAALKAKNPRKRRWHPSIIRLCLTIWGRCPQSYKDLRESGFLALPSGRLLSYYKNSVEQKPGFNDEILHWMRKEAEKRGMTDDGWEGGIMFDEMSIQEDLQINKRGGKTQLVGFVNMGQESECIRFFMNGKEEKKLASHVLQLVYLADNGYRFPFCHFPTTEANSSELFNIFWRAVSCLHKWGFKVGFACMDGSSNNRSFLKMHFMDDMNSANPRKEQFTTTSLYGYNQKVSFIMDPSHLFKKIRNNILKSGSRQYDKRLLQCKENTYVENTG
ncbi:uncharacterized protein [Ptychodera flava]|uniref:uncharacterized protein n=1 Tax=Ptychodera flava TaxID=63121 RepID=UPI00396A395D